MKDGESNPSLDFLMLIVAGVGLLIPGVAAVPFFAVPVGGWLWRRRRSGPVVWVVAFAVAVLVSLVVDTFMDRSQSDEERLRQEIQVKYQDVWRGLDAVTEQTRRELAGVVSLRDRPQEVFDLLNGESKRVAGFSPTRLLIDGRGRVHAWGGPGLLHDVGQAAPLVEGRSHLASFGATTLISIRALDVENESWHLAAGLSLRTDGFPFGRLGEPIPRWTVAAEGSPIDPGALRFSAGVGPELIVDSLEPRDGVVPDTTRLTGRRVAWTLWGLGLLVISWVVRGRAQAGGTTTVGSVQMTALGTAVGLALLGLGLAAPWWSILLLGLGGFLSILVIWSEGAPGGSLGAIVMGILAAMVVPVLATALGRRETLPDLGSELWADAAHLVMRAALALLVWCVLGWVKAHKDDEGHSSGKLMLLGFATGILSAALLDRTVIALILLGVSGICFALWRHYGSRTAMVAPAGVLALVAALVAGTGWEVAHRVMQRKAAGGSLLAAMAPPTASEIESLADEMQAFLSSSDVGALAPVSIESLSREDLAFEIWHHSPLTRFGGLSALRILPHDGGLSSFSYGLPLNRDSWVDWASPLWGSAPVPVWEDAVLVGDGQLNSDGEPWAYGEYALVLQPGFRLRQERDEDLAQVLLRAGPSTGEAGLLRLRGAAYALYDQKGQALVAPWPQPPALPTALVAGGQAEMETPEGRALAFSATGADGIRVIFLQLLSAPAALERVGTHAVPTVLLIVVLALMLQVPQLAQRGIGESWFHLWHSYSRRLVLVYSVLLLVPLGIINFLVVRAFEDRLVQDQKAAGLLAVESAQGVLGEYVLALQPGFGIDAALDHEVLFWLSSVVHHDVNLYWRGSVYASSKAELFAAGLLPRRIPGEIYSDLTLLGHEVSMRTNRAGGTEYLELYAPLTVPGVSLDQTRLIVSLPLLAQQAETAAQISSLRRRSLLGTVGVVLLIAAVGARLARTFTSPLTDIVAGTQRIAAGDPSLNLEPAELELATLVDAIDDMAARIHAGR